MAWDPNHVRAVLVAAGLVEDSAGIFAGLSISFTGPAIGGWQVSSFGGLTNGDVDEVTFGIFQVGDQGKACKGTRHRVFNQTALAANVQKILAALTSLATNDASMKCPDCKVRWVHMKESTVASTKPFAPFLSCDGMQVTRSRSMGKHTICNGVSRAIPALLVYS